MGPCRSGPGPAFGSSAAGRGRRCRPGTGGSAGLGRLRGAGLRATSRIARAVSDAPAGPAAAGGVGARVRRRSGTPPADPVRQLPGGGLPARTPRRAGRLLRDAPASMDPRPPGRPWARRGLLAADHIADRGHRPGEPGRHAAADHSSGALRAAAADPLGSTHPTACVAGGRGGSAPDAGRHRRRRGGSAPVRQDAAGEAHGAGRVGPPLPSPSATRRPNGSRTCGSWRCSGCAGG